MNTIKRFQDLRIWNDSRKLVVEIYSLLSNCKDFGFKDQIQRASVSIMNNIAEGFERNSDADFRRFLIISKASCGELRSMLYLANDLNYIENEKAVELINRSDSLSNSIGSFAQYLKSSSKTLRK